MLRTDRCLTPVLDAMHRWLPVWNYAASFYPAKLHRTEELDPDKNYIFAAHPHGIFCSSLFLAFSTESLGFSKIFPGGAIYDGLCSEPLSIALFDRHFDVCAALVK